MIRPKRLRVGSQRYQVKYDGVTMGAADDADGVCLPKIGVIALSPNLSPDRERETLFHEVMHAAWDQTHLREQERAQEEAAISALSPVLFAFLKANPKVVEYMMEEQ